MNIYIHSHTHTHIYIIYMMCVSGLRRVVVPFTGCRTLPLLYYSRSAAASSRYVVQGRQWRRRTRNVLLWLRLLAGILTHSFTLPVSPHIVYVPAVTIQFPCPRYLSGCTADFSRTRETAVPAATATAEQSSKLAPQCPRPWLRPSNARAPTVVSTRCGSATCPRPARI